MVARSNNWRMTGRTAGVVWGVVGVLVLWHGTSLVRSEGPAAAATQPAAATTQPVEWLNKADEALARLKVGNERFRSNQPLNRDFSQDLRSRLAEGQQPFAVVLTCADSRLPPELIFDQSKGDIFVVRVAGNVTDPVVLGSIEYAMVVLKVSLVVVMGHEDCGAVKSAMSSKDAGPNIQAILERIRPGIQKVQADQPEALHQAIADNVRHVVATMPKESPIIQKALEAKQVKIVGSVYSIATGKVTWLE